MSAIVKHSNDPWPTLIFYSPQSCLIARSPETAPTDVVLAQVLEVRRLAEQLLNLFLDRQLLVFLEVATCQLLFNSAQHLQRARVLNLLLLNGVLVAVDVRHARAVVAWTPGAAWSFGGRVRIASHD